MLYGRYAPDSSVKIFLLSGFRSASLSNFTFGFQVLWKKCAFLPKFLAYRGKKKGFRFILSPDN